MLFRSYKEENKRIKFILLNQLDLILNLRTVNNNKNSIFIQTYFFLLYNLLLEVFIKTVSLINSGNIALVFTDKDLLIKKHNIIIKRLLILKPLYFINRLPFSFITYYFIAKMTISHYIKFILFYIIKLSPLTVMDLIYRAVQVLREDLYWIRISA